MRWCSLSLGLALFFGAARANASDDFRSATPLPAEDLTKVRAGFIDVNGVEFSYAVLVQTFVNGQLALSSQLTVDSVNDVTSTVSNAANPTPISVSDGASTTAANGATTVLQIIAPSQVVNVVATSANNQAIVQNTSISLYLQNYAQNENGYALAHALFNLTAALNLSALTRH